MERRLAAIVSADIVGYSRLIDLDEAGTHGRVMALLEALKALIARRGGRIIKTTGDGALVLFDSVVDAIACALEAQSELADTADDIPSERRLNLRIGVNLGDVILEDGDVYGQGVNIAVRLEQVAKSGSVYVSRAAVEQARGKVAARFEPVGKIALKNIAEPVEVFSAVPGDPGEAIPSRVGPRMSPRRLALAGAAGLTVVVAAFAAWWLLVPGAAIPAPPLGVAPSSPRDDSIAVLPFADLGGKEDSGLIVDGVFDDLITDLSKLNELTVLAASSVEDYRGRDIAPLSVADELAVRYVLEGSVRQVAEDLRINVRLIDSRERKNAWAQSYSGPITDIFKFQDNMVENIVSSLAIRVSEAERGRVLARETASVPAYEAFRRGQAALLLKTPENLPVALAAFREAIGIDPQYSQAYAGLGQVYWNAWVWGWESSLNESEATAPGLARQYLERALQRPTATAYQLASDISLYARNFDDSLNFARLAVEFAPSDPASHMVMAEALIYGGRPGEAIPWVEAANRLGRDASRRPPAYNAWVLGMAFFGEAMYAEAVALFEDALNRNPDDFGPSAPLAAAYAHLAETASGEEAERYRAKAKAALDFYIGGTPGASIDQMRVYWPFRDQEDEDRLTEPLRALGLPETASG
jgi:class 3 adenylate cyclase/TolB-like protein